MYSNFVDVTKVVTTTPHCHRMTDSHDAVIDLRSLNVDPQYRLGKCILLTTRNLKVIWEEDTSLVNVVWEIMLMPHILSIGYRLHYASPFPQNLLHTLEIWTQSITWFLGPWTHPTHLKTASESSQPFFHNTRSILMDRWIDRPTEGQWNSTCKISRYNI